MIAFLAGYCFLFSFPLMRFWRTIFRGNKSIEEYASDLWFKGFNRKEGYSYIGE